MRKYIIISLIFSTFLATQALAQTTVYVVDDARTVQYLIDKKSTILGSFKTNFTCGLVYLFTSNRCIIFKASPVTTDTQPTIDNTLNYQPIYQPATSTVITPEITTVASVPAENPVTIVQPKQVIYQVIERAVPGLKGDKGDQGIQGPAGAPGVSATNYTGSNYYSTNYTPGAQYYTTSVGPQGPQGIPGVTTVIFTVATQTKDFVATGTATITNLVVNNSTSTSFFTNLLTALNANFQNLISTTITASSTQTTNLSATNATITNLVGTNATFTNLSVPVLATTSGNIMTTNIAGSVATTSIITGNTLSYTGGASNTLSSTINGVLSTTSINTLNNISLTGTTTVATITAQQVGTTGLTATNATITNLSITNLLCNITWNFFCDEGNTRGKILTLGTNDNYALDFETNNVTNMTLATNGYLGLGTTTPTSYITAVASTARPLLTMGNSTNVNTGSYSALIGGTSTNTGAYSLVTGFGNDSTAIYATTFGRYNTHTSGTYSLLSGYMSTSSATYAITAGDRLLNSGTYSAVFGTRNSNDALASLVYGYQNTNDSSHYSIVGGANSTSSASSFGVMAGSNLYATGSNYSAVFGLNNFIDTNADSSITSGNDNYNDGYGSIMGGRSSTNTANYSAVVGHTLNNSGIYSAVFGTQNTNSGLYSIVGGWLATNTGSYNLVNGYSLMSSGSASIVAGFENKNLENFSNISGYQNYNSAVASMVYGSHATNTGPYSIVGGSYNQSSGYYSNVGGVYNNNLADYGFVQGYNNTNRSFLGTYFGRYAEDATSASSTQWIVSDPLFVVANGTSTTTRANAMTLLKNGNFGIGTSSPATKFEVVGSIVPAHIRSTNNFMSLRLTGNNDTTNGGYLGSDNGALVFANQDGLEDMRISSTGNVGIGTNIPSYKLEVLGDINAIGNVRANGVVLTSDSRFKQDVQTIGTSTLDKFNQINPVSYTWNELGQEQGGTANQTQYGFLAQEVEQLFPELVSTRADGYKGVNYFGFIAMIVEAVKEMGVKVDGLVKTLINHEERIKAIEEKLQIQDNNGAHPISTSDPSVDWSDPTTSTPLSCLAGTQYDSTTNSCVAIPSTTDTTATTTPTTGDTTTTTPTTTTTDPAPAPTDPVVTDPAPVQ
jgi:hypothetical protein